MPTMAKLVSAILLAALGYVVADLVGGHMPEEERQDSLRPVVAILGLWIGWAFLGKRVDGAWNAALGMGISAGVALMIVSLFWFSGYEMLRKATRQVYGGDAFGAVQDMFQIAFEYLPYLAYADVIGVAVAGSAALGFVATAVKRRFT